MRIRVSRLRRWRMTSWPAACGMRWVKPSIATALPSRILAATASARDMNCGMEDVSRGLAQRFYGPAAGRSIRARNRARRRRTRRARVEDCLTRISRMSHAAHPLPDLPSSLHAERQGAPALLCLAPPQKRNALDDGTVRGIETFFTGLPDDVKAVVLSGEGEHFSAGLDLGELTRRD